MELDNSESHPKQVPAFLPLLFVAIVAKRFSKLQANHCGSTVSQI